VPIVLAAASASTSWRARLEDRTTHQTFCAWMTGLAVFVAIAGLFLTTAVGIVFALWSEVRWGCVDCHYGS
jgi:hypothetical protein